MNVAVTALSVATAVTLVCTVMLQCFHGIVVSPLSVYIANTPVLLSSLSQCNLGHCCHSTVKYTAVTTTDVTLVTIVTAVTLVHVDSSVTVV